MFCCLKNWLTEIPKHIGYKANDVVYKVCNKVKLTRTQFTYYIFIEIFRIVVSTTSANINLYERCLMFKNQHAKKDNSTNRKLLLHFEAFCLIKSAMYISLGRINNSFCTTSKTGRIRTLFLSVLKSNIIVFNLIDYVGRW